VTGYSDLARKKAKCVKSSQLPTTLPSRFLLCSVSVAIMRAKILLRVFLLFLAGLASAAVSLLSLLLSLGVFFFFTVDHWPAKDIWSIILLCAGSFLSGPVFLVLLVSPKWQTRIMWVIAGASWVMSCISVTLERPTVQWPSIPHYLRMAFTPFTLPLFLIALLVTVSHLIGRHITFSEE